MKGREQFERNALEENQRSWKSSHGSRKTTRSVRYSTSYLLPLYWIKGYRFCLARDQFSGWGSARTATIVINICIVVCVLMWSKYMCRRALKKNFFRRKMNEITFWQSLIFSIIVIHGVGTKVKEQVSNILCGSIGRCRQKLNFAIIFLKSPVLCRFGAATYYQ